MRRTTILNAKQVKRTSFSEAEQLFTKHCKLKNLSPQTMRYYAEDLKYFHACVPVQYVDEVSQDAFENFIVSELDAGKKITSLNSRIRGLRVFFKFCAEREYMKPIIRLSEYRKRRFSGSHTVCDTPCCWAARK